MTRLSVDEHSVPLTHPSHQSFTYEGDEITEDPLYTGVHLASLVEKKRLWWRNATINALFIASWFFFATILSVYNKWMFSSKHFGFPYPLFVTTIHMLIQFILAASMRLLWPKHFKPKNKPSVSEYGKKALPTAVTSSLDIGLSNLSLKTITLSFYTMCKSSSLIFVLLFAFLFRLEVFSWRLVAVIFLIFSGVLLMVATETTFVLEGLILVLSASAFGGLRWSLTQLLLHNKKIGLDNPAATVYWLAPPMGITLAIVSAAVESWGKVFRSAFFGTFGRTVETTLYLAAPGVLAFCMVMSEFYIIQRTGVIPMSITGIAKEVTTITISAWFFGDQLTPLNITGVSITICGITLFTYHKYRKSIQSAVPLDAHGNQISTDDGFPDSFDEQYHVELEETVRLAPRAHENDDETFGDHRRLLFSADDGDDDVGEARNILSPKSRWDTADHGSRDGSGVGQKDTQTTASESMEVSKARTRDNP